MGIAVMRLSRLKGVIRRMFLCNFRKSYVKRQLSYRSGQCNQCGKCCELAFRCPFLTKSRACLIYERGRPEQCKIFPIDQRDLNEIDGVCGYYFV